jgi:hypothetical protein
LTILKAAANVNQPDLAFENEVERRASKTGDGETIQEHESENLIVRIGTKCAAF